MPLLCEFAITPDVFDTASYSSEELAEVHLIHLKKRLQKDSVVRNLRNGAWLNYFLDSGRSFNKKGFELIVWMKTHNRLRDCPLQLKEFDASEYAWCEEALNSHASDPLNGIICSEGTGPRYQDNQYVSAVNNLEAVNWWTEETNSVTMEKNGANYIAHLSPILKYANSIMIVDAYLDPVRPQFRDVIDVLKELKGRNPMPPVEIHRLNSVGSGSNREAVTNEKWEKDFCEKMSALVTELGLKIEVFLWDYIHDRHIITDMAGFLLGNSLDTTSDPRSPVTWSRISREDRDKWQKFYDPAVRGEHLIHRFSIE